MYLSDFKKNNVKIENIPQLISSLKVRYSNDSNHFILSHSESNLPDLSFFVTKDLCVAYFIEENSNFVSISNINLDDDVVFYENDLGTEIVLSKHCVISNNFVEIICIDFFKNNEIPKSIEWQEL